MPWQIQYVFVDILRSLLQLSEPHFFKSKLLVDMLLYFLQLGQPLFGHSEGELAARPGRAPTH